MTTNWKKTVAMFISGQSISLFGSMLVNYAVQWHITLTEKSGMAMMLLTLSSAIPLFIISPFGGVWADRHSKKFLIAAADMVIAAVTLAMALFFSLGFEYIALLMVCLVVRGFGQGVQTPAVNSLIPELVPEEHLIRVNGINGSVQSIIMFVSPIAGGALIALMPVQTVLFVDVITAVIATVLLIFCVKVPKKERIAEPKTALSDIKEGFRYISKNSFVKMLLIINVLNGLLITPASVLTPLQTVRDFGDQEWRLVAIELAFFVGMTIGGVTISAWGGFKNKSYTMALGICLAGLSTIGLGVSGNFVVYLIFMGLTGMFVAMINPPLMTVLQTKVDPNYMGRVFSVLMMLSGIVMPMGMLLWGPLADMVPISLLLIISGAGVLLLSSFFILSKTLREAGKPAEKAD